MREQTDGQTLKHKVVFVLQRLMDGLCVVGNMGDVCIFFLRSAFHVKVRGRALRISGHETERAEGVLSS